MISLLAPQALAALVGAAAPLVIHLLTRRQATTRPFPALSFVMRAHAGRAAPSWLRELLVLALRMLALAALAAALAGPLWRAFSSDARLPGVIILDASASMHQRVGGATAWEHAQAAVRRLADETASRPLTLLIAGRPLERSSPLPLADRGPLLGLLSSSAPSWTSGTTAEALGTAVELLRATGGDCWLVGDGSRGGWAGVDPSSLPRGVRLHPVAVDGGGANVAVRAIALEPALAVSGRPLALTAELANYSDRAVKVSVRLRLGDETRDGELTVPADGSAVLAERFTPTGGAGWLALSAAITSRDDGGDALPEDDRRDGAVELLPAIPVTVASDGDANDPRGALKPLLAALAAAGLAPERATGATLAQALRRGGSRRVLVTAGLAGVPDAAPISAHLLAGGAWLQVLVSEADARLAGALGDLAPPAKPGALVDLTGRSRGFTLGPVRSDHPLLGGLKGREPLLAQVDGWRYRPAVLGEGAQALLSWSDGSPALSERPVGSGRWLMLGISPAEADSSLAALEATPLMIEPLGRVLLPPRRVDAAEPCGAAVPSDSALTGPGNARAVPFDGAVVLDRPGLWRAANGWLAAAAIPAIESDLRQRPAPGGGETVSSAQAAADAAGTSPLWQWLLLAAVLLLAIEQVIAGGPRRAKSAA